MTTYDPTTSTVVIPGVAVGPQRYRNVTLRNRGNFVFDLVSAQESDLSTPVSASYEASTGVLMIPAVRVGDQTYVDVRLLNQGQFVFAMQAANPLPDEVKAGVAAFFAAFERQYASSVPATLTEMLALYDTCWLHDGHTRDSMGEVYLADTVSARELASKQVGRKVTRVQVLAVRDTASGGTLVSRQVDVEYDLTYPDGTRQAGLRTTLVAGSSSGPRGCDYRASASGFRDWGNRQVAKVGVFAYLTSGRIFTLSAGAPSPPFQSYSRGVQFRVVSPAGLASYAVVTGPGPDQSVGDVSLPFSLKLLSPFITRGAPELQGQAGNYVNERIDRRWSICRAANRVNWPNAKVADCTGYGASGSSIFTASTQLLASDDALFEQQGWVVGGQYRFDLFDDDGWKTVNGQTGRSPVATYWAKLERLPVRFVDFASTVPSVELGAITTEVAAARLRTSGSVLLPLRWSIPSAKGLPTSYIFHSVFGMHQGSMSTNTASQSYPRYNYTARRFPGQTAMSIDAFTYPALVQGQGPRSSAEVGVSYMPRDSEDEIYSSVAFY